MHRYHLIEHGDSCHIDDNQIQAQKPIYGDTGHTFPQLLPEDIHIGRLKRYNRIPKNIHFCNHKLKRLKLLINNESKGQYFGSTHKCILQMYSSNIQLRICRKLFLSLLVCTYIALLRHHIVRCLKLLHNCMANNLVQIGSHSDEFDIGHISHQLHWVYKRKYRNNCRSDLYQIHHICTL